MRGRAVWSLSVALVLASARARAECTKDTDCKGDRVCDAGKCTAPKRSTPAPSTGAGNADAATAAGPGAGAVSAAPSLATPLVPEAPPKREEPPVPRRSRFAMTAGVFMVSIAPFALIGAAVARNSQSDCDAAIDRDYPDHRLPTSQKFRVDQCNGYSTPIYVLAIGGGALAAAGIPLIIYGARRVPTHASASLQLLPWAGRQSGGLGLRLEL